MNFPDINISKDPDQANYQNYLAWQARTAARRRDSRTQFNMFQTRALERMVHQAQYKEEAERESEATKDMVERRLSQACNCENCYTKTKSRSNSEPSVTPSSPTQSTRSWTCSLTRSSSESPPGTTVRGPTSPSSRNSLIASSPPRYRHHKRRAKSMTE